VYHASFVRRRDESKDVPATLGVVGCIGPERRHAATQVIVCQRHLRQATKSLDHHTGELFEDIAGEPQHAELL
jgi:hypothetical protein